MFILIDKKYLNKNSQKKEKEGLVSTKIFITFYLMAKTRRIDMNWTLLLSNKIRNMVQINLMTFHPSETRSKAPHYREENLTLM